MSILFQGNEHLIDALVVRLESDMQSLVDRVNTEDTKNIQLKPIADVLDYMPTPTLLNRFPTIGIQDGASDLTDDVGFGGTGVHNIVAVCFVQDSDQRRLAVSLRRYARCLWSVMLDGRRLGDGWGVVDRGIRPGPTLGREEGPREWMSWVAVAIEVRAEEDPA